MTISFLSSTRWLLAISITLAGGALHCGSDDTGAGSTTTSSSATSTTGTGGAGGGDAIPTFNGCPAADYEDLSAATADRTIQIAAMGLTYTPKCMIVGVGQTVSFSGSLTAHPLSPGNPADPAAGSPENPIPETTSGNKVDVTFSAAGTFPYHCKLHGFDDGKGMAGVVHVQ